MQVFDDAPVHHGNPLPRSFGFFKRRDLAAGQINLGLGWRKGGVGHVHLCRVDQGFAVKPHVAPLFTLNRQPSVILERIVDAIDDYQSFGLGGQIDGIRRERILGNVTAVLLGDYLISHAYHLCSSLDDQFAARTIAATTNTGHIWGKG